MPQKDLAELLSITSASTVRLVDRLCRDGWAERIADPSDRRIKRIAPTQKAVDAWDEMSFHAKEITTRAYAGLSPEEINAVKILLQKVRNNLQVV
jgi:DNA-binding MarR family transcriptional regulator